MSIIFKDVSLFQLFLTKVFVVDFDLSLSVEDKFSSQMILKP